MEDFEIKKETERKDKVRTATTLVWTLLTACIMYATYAGVMTKISTVVVLMLYYIGILAANNRK